MATGPMNEVVRQLRRAVSAGDGSAADGELLQCFLDHHDEAAFETLVRRHGPMVLGVCRRILQNQHDAEDAFQATFLVLVRKGDSIVPREMVGNWLYGVAYRTARKAKAMIARQRAKETQVAAMSEPPQTEPALWDDLKPLLDQELNRLPDKYRVPVVLCDLEGKTRTEAARQLGWREGTLSWRLASARTMLARRLARHGLALSAGSLAMIVAPQATAAVPSSLMASTVQAGVLTAASQAVAAGVVSVPVAALTKGVLQTMWWTQIKRTTALVIALMVLGTGLGVVSYRTLADSPERQRAPGQADGRRQENPPQEVDRAAKAQRQREVRPAPDFDGKITAISDDGKSLTLESGGRRGEEAKQITVKLTEQTKIEFIGVLKDLPKKLKVGDLVAVHLSTGSKDTLASVQAPRLPDITGKITAVSADQKLLTLEVPGPARGEAPGKVEIKLTDKTPIEFPRGVAEEKLQVDFIASVWLQEGSRDTALAVQAGRRRQDAGGEVTAISADGKTLTLQSKTRGGDAVTTEVKLTDATRIEYALPEGAEKKLQVGNHVAVWFAEGTETPALVQVVIERRNADVRGTISAISADGKAITLETQRRGEDATKTEIKLTDKTKLEFAGTDKDDEKKLTVGYSALIWLQAGSTDTAGIVRASKPVERRR